MNYHYYSLPRFERSYSLDRVDYSPSSAGRIHNISKNLLEDYQWTRGRSRRSDSAVLDSFNRALSVSPGDLISPEHVQTRYSYYPRRQKTFSLTPDEEILPTSHLKAHAPPKYTFILNPYEYRFRSSLPYANDDFNLYPNYYSSTYLPRIYNSFNNRGIGLNYDLYYPKRRPVYSLSRVPESQYYYRYNVLPYYGYDANDMLRDRRRKINRRVGYYQNLNVPSLGFFSGMRKSLNNIQDKLESHRLLLNRYTGIDMTPHSSSVGENILEKSHQFSYRKRY